MRNNTTPRLVELTWREALPAIRKVNSGMAQVIEELNLSNDHTLIKVSYPWGQHILKNGSFYLPDKKGHFVPTDRINPTVKEKLNYNEPSVPLGVVTNKTAELYFDTPFRTVPYILFSPGNIFGLWLTLREQRVRSNIWEVDADGIMAGAHSLFMLPKISDVACYKKLRQAFELRAKMPVYLPDQRDMFLELASHSEFPSDWHFDVLFFTNKWIKDRKAPKWRLFREFLLDYAWQSTNFLREQVAVNLFVSSALINKNLRPNPYLSDTAKHLYAIAGGGYPGFKIADNDNSAPIKGFQQVFSDIYGLKYVPTLVHPGYLAAETSGGVYYSLELPTLFNFSPKSKKGRNKLDDLREVKHIIENTNAYMLEAIERKRDRVLHHILGSIRFDYFHTEVDEYEGIKSTRQLLKLDETIANDERLYNNKSFCETSPFLRGCIRISRRQR